MKKLSEMPYYNTNIDAERSKGEILKLLNKYGINDYQWTKLDGRDSLKFVISLTDKSKRIIDLQIPDIYAQFGKAKKDSLGKTYYDTISVPENQKFRMFYFALKGLIEATEFGLLTLEDIFYSNTLVLTDNGKITKMKNLRAKNVQLLQENYGEN